MVRNSTPIRDGRRAEAFAAIFQKGGAAMTVADVAEALGLKSDRYVRDLLFELCEENWLTVQDVMIDTPAGRRLAAGFTVKNVPEGYAHAAT